MKFPLYFLFLVSCLSGVTAFGQQKNADSEKDSTTSFLQGNLSETVVTGVAQPVKVENALSQYRVITKAAMQAKGAVTLSDALATMLNINLGNDPILGTTIQVQGVGGDKVKLLVDGLPIEGRENGGIDLGQINLNNIERIEIVQGPMSVTYGSDALGGVINLITKKKIKPWELNAGFNTESIGKYNVDASVGRRWKRHQVLVSGARNFFQGWGDLDTAYPKRSQLFKPKTQYVGNLAYNYTAPSGFHLQLASDFVKEKVTNKGSVNGWPYAATATDEYYHTTRSTTRLLLDGKLGKDGRWSLQNSYELYDRNRQTLIKDLVTLQEHPSTQPGVQDTSRFDYITLRSNYSNHLGRLRLDGGYDIALQHGQSGKFDSADNSKAQSSYALYANSSLSFFDEKLTAQIGLRGIYDDQYGLPFIYAFNMLYKPAAHLQLRASVAKGFRAPTLKERYLEFFDIDHHITGNENLKAEEGINSQLSASWQYKTEHSWKGNIVATGFYNDIRNGISLVSTDPSQPTYYSYANISHLRNYVLNLQHELEWKQLYVAVGGGFTHVFGTGDSVNNYHSFNTYELLANAHYSFRKINASIFLFYKFTGDMHLLTALPDGNAIYNGVMPSYQLFDASVQHNFWKKKVQLIAGVKNIFDVRNLAAAGANSLLGSVHGDGNTSFLPRRFFATVRLTLN